MHTIVLATQKGGSGKSTLAIGLARAAIDAGHTVRLIETDQQGTLSNWQARRGFAEPRVDPVYAAGDIADRLERLAEEGVTLTIVDTAGGVGASGGRVGFTRSPISARSRPGVSGGTNVVESGGASGGSVSVGGGSSDGSDVSSRGGGASRNRNTETCPRSSSAGQDPAGAGRAVAAGRRGGPRGVAGLAGVAGRGLPRPGAGDPGGLRALRGAGAGALPRGASGG